MYTKIGASMAVAAALALLASGCQSSHRALPRASDGDGSGDQVTINMMHLWPEGSSAQQYKIVNQIIREYHSDHPNVTIKQEAVENEQYKSKMKVLAASNQLPDVGMTWAAGYLEPFVQGNLFTPLDDLLQGDLKNQFVAGTTEAYSLGGKTYALPLEFNLAPIYYNKKIFAQYDLRVPTTYDDFLDVVRRLVDAGIEPIALGNKDRWSGSLWYMYLADRIASPQKLADAIGGRASFTDPGLVKAAKSVQELVDMNAFVRGFNGLSNDEGKAEFVGGKAAMFLAGTWELPNYTTNPNVPQDVRDNIGFFKFPTVDGAAPGDIDSWVGGPGVGLFVAEDSPVKEQAKAFVEYFVKRWGEQAVTGAGVIPATKVDTSAVQLPQLYVDLLGEMKKATNITLFADVQMSPGAAEVHLNQIQALFGKAVTPEQFAEAHDKAMKVAGS